MLSTGGTIASVPSEEGLVPAVSGDDMLRLIPELGEVCEVDCKEILNLDSTNIQPEEWAIMAEEAYQALQEYDGVVIAHGTDTMAYSAAALSFMIRNLSKPVILTGAQLPIEAPGTDGISNLLQAFRVASSGLPGVYIVFNGRIIRGSRARKVCSRDFDAFRSINTHDVGKIEDGRVILEDPVEYAQGYMELDTRLNTNVLLLRLVPGMDPGIIELAAQKGYDGIIIESFGCGGLPYHRRNYLPAVEKAIASGTVVVVNTQCALNGSDLTVYDVGVKALKIGVIPAWDMTTEASAAKLMCILGQTRDPGEVRRLMAENFAGELGNVNVL